MMYNMKMHLLSADVLSPVFCCRRRSLRKLNLLIVNLNDSIVIDYLW